MKRRERITEISDKVDLYVSVKKYEAAEKLLKSSISELGEFANLYNLLGLVYIHQSRFQFAVEAFHRALRINPDFVEAGLNLSAILCDLGRYEDAREVYDQVSKKSENHRFLPTLVLGRLANQHKISGQMYEDAGDDHAAIEEYKKALNLYAAMPDVMFSLSKLYFKLGQTKKAETTLTDLLKIESDHIEANMLLGVIYAQHGQVELAKNRFGSLHHKDPTSGIIRAYYDFSKTL